MGKARLILLRHGESIYNKEGLFTGWTDVALSQKGKEEAEHAGMILQKHGIYPDICFTSWLKRSIHTAQRALETMAWEHIDLLKSWRLNERHYGAWQGLEKGKIREEVGQERFLAVRRGYDTPPPPIDDEAFEALRNDPKYRLLDASLLPRSESLRDTRERTLAYFYERITPELDRQRTVLISAHGNSLRALLMEIEHVSAEEIVNVEIPTGRPILYALDEASRVVRKEYLE